MLFTSSTRPAVCPKGVPDIVVPSSAKTSVPKDPGHPYSKAESIRFDFYNQRASNELFVSLPPTCDNKAQEKKWPIILLLHGAGESQRGKNESFASIRRGIPKVTLCYEKLKSDPSNTVIPRITIPQAPRSRPGRQTKQGDKSVEPVPAEVCTLVAENFITITPSPNMAWGYGWNAPILSALLDGNC